MRFSLYKNYKFINNSKFANQFQIYKFLFKFKEYISNPEIMNLGYV